MLKNRMAISERVFVFLDYVLLTLLSFCFLIPFMIVLGTSFLSQQEIIERGYVLIPKHIDLTAYKMLLREGSDIISAYGITALRIFLGTTLNLLVTGSFAYAMAKRDLPGRNLMILLCFITMFFGGGLIPTYMIVSGLKLTNTIWALIVPGLMSVWNMLLMRNFFYGIPTGLEESAFIDGATPITIFFKIMIPLSLPAFATIGLFYAVGHWNSWFDAAIYCNEKLYPVQLILRKYVTSMSTLDIDPSLIAAEVKPPDLAVKSTAIVVSTVPILFVYPFIQKYFVKGVMVGSVKG